jgi:hypothetical protein
MPPGRARRAEGLWQRAPSPEKKRFSVFQKSAGFRFKDDSPNRGIARPGPRNLAVEHLDRRLRASQIFAGFNPFPKISESFSRGKVERSALE